MIFVIDASVAVKWYLDETHTAEALALLDDDIELHGPELLLPEFGNILWKKCRRNEITTSNAGTILSAFRKKTIRLHSHETLLQAALFGANSTGQTVYDWTYLALAISLSVRFVTADERFFRALEHTTLRRHLVWVGDIEQMVS